MRTRHIFIALAAAALLGVAAYGSYTLGLRRGVGLAAPAAAPAMPTAPERKVLYWHDPMAPGTRFDKPGKSPFMDMALVPVYADPASEAGVSISPRAQQNLGVRTAQVLVGPLASRVEATGSVAWNERDVAVVSARAAGFVDKLYVRAPFDAVTKGQVLARMYVPDWVAAQEEFLSVRRMQGGELKSLVDAARQRMRLAGMSDEQIARIDAGGQVEPRIAIVAPIDGVIAELGVREGAAVAMGTPLFRINGLSTVWVNAEVPEGLAAQLRTGTEVEAQTPRGPKRQGKVGAIVPEVSATTRTVKVRVELPNADRQLLPGMFATLRFRPAALGAAVLSIPSEALIATGERNLVMVALDQGGFMPVEVERGIEADGRIEIRKGLQAGQRIVVSGQFLIDSEASLKGLQSRQGASGVRQ